MPANVYDARKVLAFGEACCVRRGVPASAGNIGDALGVTRRTVVRWRHGHSRSVKANVIDGIETRHGVHASHFEREEAA